MLCGTFVSKSFVSKLTAELDPMVNEWRNRSLSEMKFPYIVTDVLYIKAEKPTGLSQKVCHIAIEINEDDTEKLFV